LVCNITYISVAINDDRDSAHGWNHAFGGGKLTATAQWFASIGNVLAVSRSPSARPLPDAPHSATARIPANL
jgi:hypothetical protein